MKLTVIGSSSSGNCYLLTSRSGDTLILEAGVRMSEVKKALDFDLSGIVGCFVTHEHVDHAKYAQEVMNCGINIHASFGTLKALGISWEDNYHAHLLWQGTVMTYGNFSVYPFDVKHDAANPFGFLIKHPEMGTCLFLTDSFYSEYKFKGLNQIILEVNYSDDILEGNLFNGTVPLKVANRVRESHMSLETAKELLRANDLSRVNNIVLIHLSNDNSDSKRFEKEITDLTAKTVTVADRGMIIDFNQYPF